MTILRSIIAEFQDTIQGVIPLIVKLLKDEDLSVQLAGGNAIFKLAEHSKRAHHVLGYD